MCMLNNRILTFAAWLICSKFIFNILRNAKLGDTLILNVVFNTRKCGCTFFVLVFSHQPRREFVLLPLLFLVGPSVTMVPPDVMPSDRQFPSERPLLPPIQTGQIKLVMVEFNCFVFNYHGCHSIRSAGGCKHLAQRSDLRWRSAIWKLSEAFNMWQKPRRRQKQTQTGKINTQLWVDSKKNPNPYPLVQIELCSSFVATVTRFELFLLTVWL